MELRDYQKRAVESAIHGFDDGAISGVVAMATGTGKTVVTNKIVGQRFPPEKYRTLIIGGVNIDVCNQMEASFLSDNPALAGLYGDNGFAAPGIGMVMAGRDETNARIVVASIQTLLPDSNKEDFIKSPEFTDKDVYMSGDRIIKKPVSSLAYLVSPRLDAILEHGKIDLWIHDEVHHAPADGTLGLIRRLEALYEFLGLDPLLFLGNTATPVRPDGRALFNVCQRVFFSYPIHKAQEDGWIVPFAPPQRVVVDLGYNNPETSEHDVRVDSTGNWIELVAKAWEDLCLNDDGTFRPTVMYTGAIHEHGPVRASQVLAAGLNEHGIKAVHVDATKTVDTDGRILNKKDRASVYQRLVEGDIHVICNCNVIIEGVDIPPISSIFLLKKMNELVLTQVVGRGTRLFPGNDFLPAKEDLLVVDFTGQQLVTTAICSLMGYMVDDEDEFEPDWEGLWDEFAMLWSENITEIQEWLSGLKDLNAKLYARYEVAINLALMRDNSFDKSHAKLIRQMLGAFGEDSLLGSMDLVDEGFVRGKDVVFKLAEIVASADNDWRTDPGSGVMSLPVGNNESLFITPPNWTHKYVVDEEFKKYLDNGNRDQKTISLYTMARSIFGSFTLWRITAPKPYNAKAKPLYSDDNLVALFNSSMDYIMNNMQPEDVFMKKKRSWKRKTVGGKKVLPTDGQMHYVRKLSQMNGIKSEAKGDLTKAEASQLINFLSGLYPIKNTFNKINKALNIEQKGAVR